MSEVRQYTMVAKAEMADALQAALSDLADLIRPLPGCEGVTLLRDSNDTNVFLFAEHWESSDARKDGGAKLGKDAFSAVMAAVGDRPAVRDLVAIKQA